MYLAAKCREEAQVTGRNVILVDPSLPERQLALLIHRNLEIASSVSHCMTADCDARSGEDGCVNTARSGRRVQ